MNESCGEDLGRRTLTPQTGSISSGNTLDRFEDAPFLVRNVVIEPLHYGYLVNVGCNRFAIEKIADVLKYLEKYYADPKDVEQLWLKHKKLPEL